MPDSRYLPGADIYAATNPDGIAFLRREMKKKSTDDSRAEATDPCVGIFYLVDGKLFVEGSSLADAEPYGDAKTHARAHTEMWGELVLSGKVPRAPYELNPRGRVSFRCDTDRFLLLADRCILRDQAVVSEVMDRLHLPADRTDTGTDLHYRCPTCPRKVWRE
jgi:hypothetical protein